MEQAMSTQENEVFTRGKWVYRDPNGGHKELPSESHEFGAIAVKTLLYCSHKEEASIISKHKRAFVSRPLLAPPGSWIVSGSSATLSPTGQAPVLPGDYIRFTVSAEPTPEQCRYMRKKRCNRYAYYLTARSVYGMYAFSADIFELMKAYADSRKCQDLVLKVGGTRHFKNQVFYVMVVCALADGRDPLPNLPNLPLAEEEGQEKIFDPGEMLDSHGRVLLVKRGGRRKRKGEEKRGGGGGDGVSKIAGEDEELRKEKALQEEEEQRKNGSEEASSRLMDEPERGGREEEKDGEERKGGRLRGSSSDEASSSQMEKPESVGEGGGDVTWVVLNELGKDKEQEKDEDHRGNGSEEPSSNPTEEQQSEQEGKEGGEETREPETEEQSQVGSNGEGREGEEEGEGCAGPPEWSYSPEAMPKFLPRNPLEVIDGIPQRYDALELVFHFPSPQFAVASEKPKRVCHLPGRQLESAQMATAFSRDHSSAYSGQCDL